MTLKESLKSNIKQLLEKLSKTEGYEEKQIIENAIVSVLIELEKLNELESGNELEMTLKESLKIAIKQLLNKLRKIEDHEQKQIIEHAIISLLIELEKAE